MKKRNRHHPHDDHDDHVSSSSSWIWDLLKILFLTLPFCSWRKKRNKRRWLQLTSCWSLKFSSLFSLKFSYWCQLLLPQPPPPLLLFHPHPWTSEVRERRSSWLWFREWLLSGDQLLSLELKVFHSFSFSFGSSFLSSSHSFSSCFFTLSSLFHVILTSLYIILMLSSVKNI